jgi:cold shock CspA family protein/tetratricopeptide (TPR) repeat protein
MDIPDHLVSQVRDGNAVIFLGAGASRGAQTATGVVCPTTPVLTAKLSAKFLGGKFDSHALNQVAEYAISESDLVTVQTFIRSLFVDLKPTAAHLKLPRFDWHGLATTNYDTLVEDAYQSRGVDGQSLRPLIENGDRVDDQLKDPRNVLYVKLHGCITRINSVDCPLILTTDQYIEHRKGRARLFDVFSTWGYEHPIIFVGQSLQDSDLRAIITQLTGDHAEVRPRYFLVSPGSDEIGVRFWESKKITTIKGTFDEFITKLDAAIPASFRHLSFAARATREHEIERKFKTKASLSKAALQFLQDDVDYINSLASTQRIEARDFYKGYSFGFGAIEQELDVRRKLADSILSDHVLVYPEQTLEEPEVVLIKAHAGAGKSVVLKRIAWDAAKIYERISLFVKAQGVINVSAIKELISSCGIRLYLFIDNATDRIREIIALIKNIGPEGKLLTVIMADRTNEWNIQGQSLSAYVTDEYELRYLSMTEIDGLLGLLEKHRVLGTLEKLSHQERVTALSERAGRQILVALYEATYGLYFEDILVDEFNKIQPYDAQRLYLTICVLNRLKVPVRAGIIARVHGIAFSDFKARFFSPLEHVVFAEPDPATRDFAYRARHPQIAEIVFLRILANAEERFDMYIKCLKALNISYSADWKAFWQMVRGRTLLDLFPDHTMVVSIFDAAKDLTGEDPHLLHQMAIYEAHRPNGKHSEALRLLSRAAVLAPYDVGIKHSAAEFKLRFVDDGPTPLERAKSLKDAAVISRDLVNKDRENAHAHHTLVKIGIRTIEEALINGASDDLIAKEIKDVEDQLFKASQLFPGDSYLLESESELAKLLSDHERALKSMVKAFDANPRNSFVALRLAQVYERQGKPHDAMSVLKKGLGANASDKRLHFALAKLLTKSAETPTDELVYHFKRSFTDGDSNYDAQLLYARQLFLMGDPDNRAAFAKLAKVHMPPQVRNRLLYPIPEQRFTGKIFRLEATHAFVSRDGMGDTIFMHISNVQPGLWKQLTNGHRIKFSLAFSFKGPAVFDVESATAITPEPAQLDLLLSKASSTTARKP